MTGQPVTDGSARAAAGLAGADLHRAPDRAAVGGAARRGRGAAAGLAGRSWRAAVLHARRLRADLRLRAAADLRVLLSARARARSDRRGSTSSRRCRRSAPASCSIDFLLAGDFEGWWAALQAADPAGADHGAVRARAAGADHARLDAGRRSAAISSAPRARSGCRWRRIVVTYALRNAILPVITIAGIVFSTMLGANVLVEKVFSWPGVASYALDALLSSDYAPVQGFVLLMAAIFVLVNLLVDVLYGIADPRVSRRMSQRDRLHGAAYRLDPARQPGHRGRRGGRRCCWSWSRSSAPWIVPYDPIASNVPQALQPPSAAHLGRHRPARPRHVQPPHRRRRGSISPSRSRRSASPSCSAPSIGAFCGYAGGRLDRWVGRFVDVLMAFPLFVLAMAMVAALGNRVENIVIATAIINLPFYIRFARAEVNVRRNVGWVEAARACGEEPSLGGAALPAAERAAGDGGADLAQSRLGDPERRRAVLHRPRRQAADAGMGHHGRGGRALHLDRASGGWWRFRASR